MAYVNTLFNKNFLEYASYVIKDRAIPDIDDGLKPVQRRIIHTLFEMDDGKFHKVANVVGHCMRYHPHGDASIFSALVVIANKELLIDKQGNFGNIFTGDEASASRYIECRATPLAKQLLYNPEITTFQDSYDGRNSEPVVFPSKVPLLLVHGAEGIAVGMSTRILPHNFAEILHAVSSALQGKRVDLYPDFPTGGYVDVSAYEGGQGRVLVRARLDTSDPKRIVIRELPFGSTTESLISSIENAARRGKVKIASISDFTSEDVEIEIKLARGVYTEEVVDALYAFTDCETSLSVNLLVIRDNVPVIMTVDEVIAYHAGRLVEILTAELELERGKLLDRLHARTLERIFVEERLYKRIEEMETHEAVHQAVLEGFEPYKAEIRRKITEEDIDRLLKIPIRRISLYDINKARKEVEEIKARLGEIRTHLANTTAYAVSFLNSLLEAEESNHPRRTEITSFRKVDVREVAERDRTLRYDRKNGYLGFAVTGGQELFDVSPYDRILVIKKDGSYSVMDVPEKLFVDTGMLSCGHADKDILPNRVFSILYQNARGDTYLKRCRIEQFILDKQYSIVPAGAKVLKLTTRTEGQAVLKYKPAPRLRVLEESFDLDDYLIKSVKASGVKLTSKKVSSADFKSAGAKRGSAAANGSGKKTAAGKKSASGKAGGSNGAASKKSITKKTRDGDKGNSKKGRK